MVVTEQPYRARLPPCLVDRSASCGRSRVLTVGELAGRDVPAPLVGDEAIPPDEQQTPLRVRQDERDDLERNPRNPRSLFGLAEALTRQKRDYDASWVRQQFETAWQGADVTLKVEDL